MNKKKLSVAAIAIALSVGTVSSATADQGHVTADGSHVGTSRLATAKTTRFNAMNVERSARVNLIATTLGMDVATLQAKLRTGVSLASLAGDKTGVLISALVNLESQEIDAAVAAGKLTATEAAAKKANLVAEETKEVNATGHAGIWGASRSFEKSMGSFGHSSRGHGEGSNFLRSSR